jgi:hypothetical protein
MEADYCMLLVRTDPDAPPHKGISALLVPMDSPGITRRPITQVTGEGGFAQVFFDDARVARSALLGRRRHRPPTCAPGPRPSRAAPPRSCATSWPSGSSGCRVEHRPGRSAHFTA